MKKTYNHIGTIDLNEISAITPNVYYSERAYIGNDHWGTRQHQNFNIYLKTGEHIKIQHILISDDADSKELIDLRKAYAELVNDYLNLDLNT